MFSGWEAPAPCSLRVSLMDGTCETCDPNANAVDTSQSQTPTKKEKTLEGISHKSG